MRVVTPTDLRKRLGELLDAASAGERIQIERDHRPLAVLVSIEDGRHLDEDREATIKRRLAALDRLDAFAKRMAGEYPGEPDDGMTTVEWIRAERERRTDRIAGAAAQVDDKDDPAPGSEPGR